MGCGTGSVSDARSRHGSRAREWEVSVWLRRWVIELWQEEHKQSA